MRKLRESLTGAIDLGVVLMIVIAFVGMMVMAYLIWTVNDQVLGSNPDPSDAANEVDLWESMNHSIGNITAGFDDALNLLLIAITIFILAIAIGALLMLRGRQE